MCRQTMPMFSMIHLRAYFELSFSFLLLFCFVFLRMVIYAEQKKTEFLVFDFVLRNCINCWRKRTCANSMESRKYPSQFHIYCDNIFALLSFVALPLNPIEFNYDPGINTQHSANIQLIRKSTPCRRATTRCRTELKSSFG